MKKDLLIIGLFVLTVAGFVSAEHIHHRVNADGGLKVEDSTGQCYNVDLSTGPVEFSFTPSECY